MHNLLFLLIYGMLLLDIKKTEDKLQQINYTYTAYYNCDRVKCRWLEINNFDGKKLIFKLT